MGTISYTIPVAGSTLNSVADPEIATALSTLLTLVNGQIDTNNLSPTANIAASQLRSVFPSGLLGGRPAAAAAGGTFYYATDAGLLYWSNGSVWTTVSSPAGAGAWTALTLNAGWTTYNPTPSFYAPAARIVGTDVVQLRGAANNGAPGTNPAILPSGAFAPASTVRLPQAAGGFITITAASTAITLSAAQSPVYLDGLSYSLS